MDEAMDVLSMCAHCRGRGYVDLDKLGTEPCPWCRCPSCGESGLQPRYQIDALLIRARLTAQAGPAGPASVDGSVGGG
jgi:hypothetical protein